VDVALHWCTSTAITFSPSTSVPAGKAKVASFSPMFVAVVNAL